jgi:hypothetical protein
MYKMLYRNRGSRTAVIIFFLCKAVCSRQSILLDKSSENYKQNPSSKQSNNTFFWTNQI